MLSTVDLVSLVLFCVQQVGMVLGVGAQTVLLGSLLTFAREYRVDEKRERFGCVVIRTLNIGLFLIVVSGVAATSLHLSFAQTAIVEAPAYLFKWILIGIISSIGFWIGKRPYEHFFGEGLLGSQWYALLVLHVLAPLVGWTDILLVYALGCASFIALWSGLTYFMRFKKDDVFVEPKAQVTVPLPNKPYIKSITPQLVSEVIIPTPPVSSALIVQPEQLPIPEEELPPAPLPAVIEKRKEIPVPQKPPLAIPIKPAEDLSGDERLPTIRVMPQRPEDINKQARESVVQFGEE